MPNLRLLELREQKIQILDFRRTAVRETGNQFSKIHTVLASPIFQKDSELFQFKHFQKPLKIRAEAEKILFQRLFQAPIDPIRLVQN